MTRYRWEHNSPLLRLHSDERIEDGETFEPTKREYDAFRDRLAEVEESEPEEEVDEDGYTCVGNDGECSRDVDTEGGRCWQHSSDE